MPIDLLGNGTACLVWSSPLPGDARRPMRYVDLMGGTKPHLLVKTVNNLGAETRVDYAPSTKFYLQDKRDGRPWITRLPFPVHVVERVETYDHISRNRFVTRYAYHHGYFDGEEREFRGFGMVEQWDTEEFAALADGDAAGGDNIDAASHVPPVLTKTWFHTGVYLGREHVSDFFAGLLDATDQGEYFREPGLTDAAGASAAAAGHRPARRPDAGGRARSLPRAQGLDAAPGGLRARRDGTDDEPYGIPTPSPSRTSPSARLQPRGDNRHAVFFTHAARGDQLPLRAQPGRPAHPARADAGGRRLRQRAQASRHRLRPPRTPIADSLPTGRGPATKQTADVLITYTENRVTNADRSTRTTTTARRCRARRAPSS